VFGWRGDADRAFRVRDSGLLEVKTDGAFRALRNDPRFRTLLRRMNLPED
jgi:hypothetical protein